jgi:hypothetical protein
MPSQDVIFEAADVEQLYRGGKPSSWEQMLERAAKSSYRRKSISGDEAHEMLYALQIIRDSGSAIPNTPRDCYLQMLEVLAGMPTPGAYPV